MTSFTLKKEEILTPGGRKSPIANKMDKFLYSRGWVEKSFNTSINIDGLERTSPTHAIDCYKNKIALNRFSPNKALSACNQGKWELLLPVLILYGVFGGFATLVETAAITVFYVFIIEVFIYKDI